MPEDYCSQYVVVAWVVMILLLMLPHSAKHMPCLCSSQSEKSLADFSSSEVVIEEVAVVKVIVVIVLLVLWLFLSHVRCSSDRRESTSFQYL